MQQPEATTSTKKNRRSEIPLQLRQHFEKTLQKKGIVLTASQLASFAREKKILFRPEPISSFLSSHPAVAHHGRVDSVVEFQTVGVPKSGMYQLDYGEFHKSWARSNHGATGFLVAVENFTNRLFVLPTKGKGTREWLDSIAKFVELTRDVRIIFTDRDSVATSPKFRTDIVEKYGIEWYFLKKGNKSFLAERYIGFVKTKLTQALESESSSTSSRSDPKNWDRYVVDLCSEYNKEKIAGTSYRRQAVSRSNFDHFMQQLLKVSDPTLLYNGFAAGPFASKSWNSKIFKFDLGDKVLVSRKANWKFPSEKIGQFGKSSIRGSFGTSIYTISGRQLRADKSRTKYIAVYSLAEFDSGLNFYTRELKKVTYSQVEK